MNEKTRRKSGILPVGEISWGTHICLFYHTKQDLIDILVPYFKVGLENNEFCMWITSEPLSAKDAKRSLRRVVKDLDSYIENGQLEIIDYSDWYAKSGRFNASKVLQGWVDKENQAIERGLDGLRLTGNTSWLEKEDWDAFADYEATINRVIAQYHMLAICTYSLDRCGATEVIEVVSNHQFSLFKREGEWEIIECAERERAEEEIHRLALMADMAPNSITVHDFDGHFLYANQKTLDLHGFSRDEFMALNLHQLDVPDSEKLIAPRMQELLDRGEAAFQVAHYRKDGSTLPLEVSARITTWGDKKAILSIATDITERKQAEQAQRFSHRLLEIANRHVEMSSLLKEFVVEVQNFTGCAAVGLRILDEEGNIPYEAYVGFSDRFYESESPLSIKSDQCMCINVIKGETDPKHSFYTKGGAFYMNGTTRFLATVSEEEKGRTRNECSKVGYESVALIPIRAEGRILGLIHVADPREKMVPLEVVEVLEGAAMQLGTALQRVWTEEIIQSLAKFPAENPNPVLRIAQDGTLLYTNQAGLSLLPELHLQVGQASPPILRESALQALDNRSTQILDIEHLQRAYSFFVAPVVDAGYVNLYGRDVTERKRAEAELIEKEIFNFALFEYNPIQTVVVDLEGKVIKFNLAKKKSGDRLPNIGDTMYKDYAGKHEIDMYAELMKCIRSGEEKEFPEQKYGDRFISTTISPFPKGAVIISDDITERKQAEEEIRKNNAELKAFVSIMSHDLKNPVISIQGFCSLLMKNHIKDLNEKALFYIQRVQANAGLMTDLLEDLIELSRIGRIEDKKTKISVQEVIKSVWAGASTSLAAQNVEFVSPENLPQLCYSEKRLYQIFYNLLYNALKFRDEERKTKVEIGHQEDKDNYIFFVRDNGIGIEQKYHNKIFESFSQLKDIKSEGTGMGLAIVKKIVEANQGKVWVESRKGAGSTFYFTIPKNVTS